MASLWRLLFLFIAVHLIADLDATSNPISSRHLLSSDSGDSDSDSDSDESQNTPSPTNNDSDSDDDDDEDDSDDSDSSDIDDDNADFIENDTDDDDSDDTDSDDTDSDDTDSDDTDSDDTDSDDGGSTGTSTGTTTSSPSTEPTVNPTAEPTAATPSPTPSPTALDIDADLICDGDEEGNFATYGAQQLGFDLDASSSAFTNSLVTVSVSGGNLTVTDSDGTTLLVLADGDSGTLTVSESEDYTVTIWQTDTSVDDWIVAMTCESAAPTSEPTASSSSFRNFGAAMEARLNSKMIEEDEENVARSKNMVIALSPRATHHLWAMALVVSVVSATLIIWCILKRRKVEEAQAEHGGGHHFAVSDSRCLVESDVYF